ncbi:MAG: GtrA family protein [Beijerinckiaceae bacterium]|nr:GtrA family protein [Beijerinckiaceae bacterium]MCI0737253.1 GtrA family protein [Beijerinckiaceae bacterium]
MPYLVRQFSSFAAVGAIATCVHYAVLIGLVEIARLSAVPAALAGFGTGGIVSYLLNRRHVFPSRAPHDETAARFAIVAAVGFGLTYVFMSLLADIARVPYLLAQIVTTGIVMLSNFAAHKMWTFRPDHDPHNAAAGRSRPPR